MSTPAHNVLISSAGRRVALLRCFEAAITELGLDGEVLTTDMSDRAPACHASSRSFQVPRCTSSEFIPRMLELVERERVMLLIPTLDHELLVYAEHRAEFARVGCHVAVSGPETIAIARDKRLTHSWMQENGFPVPRQLELAEAAAIASELSFPVIAKPIGGSCSIGVFRCETPQELIGFQTTETYIVESEAKGREFTVDMFVDRAGRCRVTVPRERLETRAGEVSKGITRHIPAVEQLATNIAETLPEASGVLNAQVFFDETTGELAVIEVNPRFGGGYPLSCQAGANCPKWLIQECLDQSIEVPPWSENLLMLRYDDAVFVNHYAG